MDVLEATQKAVEVYRQQIQSDYESLQASLSRAERERLTQAQIMIRIHRAEGAIAGLLDLINSLDSTLFVEDD